MKYDLVLINPPEPYLVEPDAQMPLGLLYLVSGMRQQGWKVAFKNLAGIPIKDCLNSLPESELYGFTTTFVDYETVKGLSEKLIKQGKKTLLGGPFVTSTPDIVDKDSFTSIIIGEGDITLNDVLSDLKKGKLKKIYNGKEVEDLDTLPFPARDILEKQGGNIFIKGKKYSKGETTCIITSRGCYYNCLSGDTKINTVEGDIPIKDLIKRAKIGVYTYDREKKEVFITEAVNIRRIGVNKELVRVTFDDGSFLDCTPDHRFLTFKNGNQFVNVKEYIKEARELKYKESVRAIKFYEHPSGYCYVGWGRRKSRRQSRLVMEYILGRKLTRIEQVHHKDKDKTNDLPNNLAYCPNAKTHYTFHPEISERMKKDNPVKYCTKESREKIRRKITGLKRSLESRLRYRDSKLGKKNPNYKDGKRVGKTRKDWTRIKEINHKVVSIEPIGKGDTYCMEVPKTNWFFANNVLVHNCAFCGSKRIWHRHVKYRSIKNVISEMELCIKKYNITNFRFSDDNVTDNLKRLKELCFGVKSLMKQLNVKIYWRVSTRVFPSSVSQWKMMKDAGCVEISFGIESFDDRVLKVLNKGTTAELNKKAIRESYEAGIKTRLLMMINTPGEKEDTAEINIKALEKLKFGGISCKIFVPGPGCDIWDSPDKFGIKIQKENIFFSKFNYFGWIRNKKGEVIKNNNKLTHKILGLSKEQMKRNRVLMENYITSRGFNTESGLEK